jgi:hypothetical protein
MNLPANRSLTPDLPPIGARVHVMTNCANSRADKAYRIGTVGRHVGGWLAEVELPDGRLAMYAPEGMEVVV